MYLHHRGGGTQEMAAFEPPEFESKYPDPHMFGPQLPAHGFFIRHAKNLEFTNVEIAHEASDERPAFVIRYAPGADFFRVKAPRESAGRVFSLTNVTDFHALATRGLKDIELGKVERQTL